VARKDKSKKAKKLMKNAKKMMKKSEKDDGESKEDDEESKEDDKESEQKGERANVSSSTCAARYAAPRARRSGCRVGPASKLAFSRSRRNT
jgi:hypothetical protein